MSTERVALITGATGGVGPDVVRAFADAGYMLAVTARHEEALAGLRDELHVPPERWLAEPADIGDPDAAQALVARVARRFGSVDILVAVAGGWRGGSTVAETDLETVAWLWRTNVLTALNAARAALPLMIERQWGRIVTIAARSALGGQARSGAYAASKAALLALTQSIAAETKNQGITANTLLISTADTPANRTAMPKADPSHWVPPAQIAATIRFLCTDEAAAISGAAIPI
ncbi:MAG TPA: SDR family NAD(P)-dependent oxidoreductase [Anaerolineae bacterium]